MIKINIPGERMMEKRRPACEHLQRGKPRDDQHLLVRDRVLGDYSWTFTLYPGKHEPWESAALSRAEKGDVPSVAGFCETSSWLNIGNPRVMLSALYQE